MKVKMTSSIVESKSSWRWRRCWRSTAKMLCTAFTCRVCVLYTIQCVTCNKDSICQLCTCMKHFAVRTVVYAWCYWCMHELLPISKIVEWKNERMNGRSDCNRMWNSTTVFMFSIRLFSIWLFLSMCKKRVSLPFSLAFVAREKSTFTSST